MSDKNDVLDRVADWPAEAQAELRQIATEIEADLHRGDRYYHATPEELEGIDRGVADIAAGKIVGADEIERLFEKHRPK